MEFFIWLILVLLCSVLVLSVKYYFSLFADGRSQYERNELLSAHEFLIKEWKMLIGEIDVGYLMLFLGVFFGLILSYLGGIFGNHTNSYFFHSAVLPVLLFLGFPFLKETLATHRANQSFLGRLIDADIPCFFGLSMAVMAQNFAVYFVYQEISFIWILLHNLAILALVLYRFYKMKTENFNADDSDSADLSIEDDFADSNENTRENEI